MKQNTISGIRDSNAPQEEIGLSMFGSVKSQKSDNLSVDYQPKSKESISSIQKEK